MNTKLRATSLAAAAIAALIMFGPLGDHVSAQPPAGGKGGKGKQDPGPQGLLVNTGKQSPGYVLFAPLSSLESFLMDMDGNIVRTWQSELSTAGAVKISDNGHVWRGGLDAGPTGFNGGGAGGRMQEWDFDGKLVWDWTYNTKGLLHHDQTVMPNGNLLVIAWETKTQAEAQAAGRENPAAAGVLSEVVMEVKPVRPNGAEIVWEWRPWDHLVAGDQVAAHPELVDINGDDEGGGGFGGFGGGAGKGKGGPGGGKGGPPPGGPGGAKGGPGGAVAGGPPPGGPGGGKGGPPPVGAPGGGKGGPGGGKGKGGPGGPGGGGGTFPAGATELFHFNAVTYNAKLDQVMISVPHYNEIWIIDHSATTELAKGHKGGKSGKGGDLLYRWGNPQTYGRGTDADQKLGFEHDAQWIPDGYPGAGNIMVFSNRTPREGGGQYTKVYEIKPPVDKDGKYTLAGNAPYGPAEPVWTYSADNFDANYISGASRLKNGNTFISSGPQGRMFEVTPNSEIVWEYVNPTTGPGGGPSAGMNPYAVFRGVKLAPDYPALKGRDLKPQAKAAAPKQ